jgi:NAD(P)-dependent dehydrogenase (short-subunit alcohol dehydrogenase family)
MKDILSFAGKVVIITGASRGLGLAYASAFAEAQAELVLTSRHAQDLEEAAADLRKSGRSILCLESDMTDELSVKEMVERTCETFGRIDVLINNAATERMNIPPEDTDIEGWRAVLETNLDGPFLCCREVGKVMIRQRKGKIINVASISGLIINKYFHGGSYDVSKSAVCALTKALAVEWAPYGITVNALAPGYYDTAPNRRWFDANPAIHEKVIDMIPLRRLGNIEELSEFMLCLASEATNYMTGSICVIDGGYTIW